MKKLTKALLILCLALYFLIPITTFAEKCGGTEVGTPGLGGICDSGQGNDLEKLITGIANWLTGIIGIVVVMIIVWSGVQMIASAGNTDAVKAARGRLTNAAIGLFTLIAMQAILRLIGIIS